MNLIVAVDENWAIGNKGKLLVSIPSDMKFFREETSGEGKAVILGRKTLESFPGGRPLKNRLNVVLTKNQDFQVEGAVVVHSVEEALEAVKDYADDKIYYRREQNNGYEGDLELAVTPDTFLTQILGRKVDSNGAVVENADDKFAR